MTLQLESSRRYLEVRRLLLAAALRLADTSWRQVATEAIDVTWTAQLARMLPTLAALQERSAREGAAYVASALDEQGISVSPAGQVRSTAFAGVASDGRRLDTLLLQPAVDAKVRIAGGATADEALASARDRLRLIVATQVQDAGRAAAGVAIAARPRVGWVRQLNPPSCSRCAVLAGKSFKWNQGFQRHPGCDCVHIPSAENAAGDLTTDPRAYFDSLDSGSQDRLFTKSGAQAIRDGADIGQVVNARRGMTAAGTTTANVRARQGGVRLMPERIYAEANGSRTEAVRLLGRFGYL